MVIMATVVVEIGHDAEGYVMIALGTISDALVLAVDSLLG